MLLSDEPGARGSPVGDQGLGIRTPHVSVPGIWNIEDIPTDRNGILTGKCAPRFRVFFVVVGMNAAAPDAWKPRLAPPIASDTWVQAVPSKAKFLVSSFCNARAAWVARNRTKAPVL